MTHDKHQTKEEDPIVKPPFFKKWSGMYWLVLGTLAFLIILFYIVTELYK